MFIKGLWNKCWGIDQKRVGPHVYHFLFSFAFKWREKKEIAYFHHIDVYL